MPQEFDASSFPLARKGNRFEDFTAGQRFVHHWGRTVTAGEAALFASVSHAYVPLYFNVEYARAHGHSACPVHPMLVLCTVVGLSVEDLSEGGGPFLGMEDVVFHRSVYPGETLTAESEVLAKRVSASRPEFGVVSWRTEARNQRGERVVSYQRSNLVRRRDAESAS